MAIELPLLEDLDVTRDGLSLVDGDARVTVQFLGFGRVKKNRTPSERVARTGANHAMDCHVQEDRCVSPLLVRHKGSTP